MMQLYDHEEIMRVHDMGVARDSAIRATVEAFQEVGLSFVDIVEKIATKFAMSKEKAEREVVNIMMQLYDQEEVMRVHILSERRDSAIRATVEAFQEVGLSFVDIVEKIATKFAISKEKAEREVSEYWNK